MGFKKLALASAIIAVPAIGFSMETIDDAQLSEMTGQDGIQIDLSMTNGISTNVYLHDKDGLNSVASTMFTSYSYDGAIVIQGMSIAAGAASTITLNIDAGDNTASLSGAPILNVQVILPATLTIVTGTIGVANSGRDDTAADFSYNGTVYSIMPSTTIILGNLTMNIQLGNEVQTGTTAGTDMIAISGSVTGGITMNNFRVNDGSTATGDHGIGGASLNIHDTNNTALTVGVDVNANVNGLVVGLNGMGASGQIDLDITNQYLGTTSAGTIGDVSVVGLNLTGATLTISGK